MGLEHLDQRTRAYGNGAKNRMWSRRLGTKASQIASSLDRPQEATIRQHLLEVRSLVREVLDCAKFYNHVEFQASNSSQSDVQRLLDAHSPSEIRSEFRPLERDMDTLERSVADILAAIQKDQDASAIQSRSRDTMARTGSSILTRHAFLENGIALIAGANLDAQKKRQSHKVGNTTYEQLDEEEFREEVTRVAQILRDPTEYCAERHVPGPASIYNPMFGAQIDSKYIEPACQATIYFYRGHRFNGGELNYYFIGMYFKEMGFPIQAMNDFIMAWKLQYKATGRRPSAQDLLAAEWGYKEHRPTTVAGAVGDVTNRGLNYFQEGIDNGMAWIVAHAP
jgi:hypothetical protein